MEKAILKHLKEHLVNDKLIDVLQSVYIGQNTENCFAKSTERYTSITR